MSNPIRFYKVKGEKYGPFANFSNHGFHLDGRWWKTSEHYYQANKFPVGSPQFEEVANMGWAGGAADKGRTLSGIHDNWDQVKDDVMRCALYAKFTQNPELKELLLSTGHLTLIEASPKDYYWGEGKWGNGQNMLGKLLMELRTQLRIEDATMMTIEQMIEALEAENYAFDKQPDGTWHVHDAEEPVPMEGFTELDIRKMYFGTVIRAPYPEEVNAP